jgi:hypothetical protein
VRGVSAAIAIGSLTGCSVLPQFGPMPVVCDDGIPQTVCDGVRAGDWRNGTDLERSNIVRIEVECLVCEPTAASFVYRAVFTDGTTSEYGAGSWVPDLGGLPRGAAAVERLVAETTADPPPDTYDARVRMRRSVLLGLVAIGAFVVLAGVAGIYAVGGRDALGYAVAVGWIVVIVLAVYEWRKKDPNRPS